MNNIFKRLKTFAACLCLLTLCTACSKEDAAGILVEVIKELLSIPKENFDDRETGQPYGYVGVRWYSDNEQVARLSYETGNQITFRVECAESWDGRRQVSVRKVNK